MSPKQRDSAWYKQVLDSITDFVMVKGARSKLLWANRAFLDYYGMTDEALQNMIDSPHSDPDDTVQYIKDDHLVYTTGKTLDIPSEPITDSHGHVRYFHTIKTPMLDDRNRIVGIVGVARPIQDEDIAAVAVRDRDRHKQQLSELRTLIHHMPLAVAMLDVRARFMAHSQAWCQLFDYGDEELAGVFYDDAFADCLSLHESMSRAIMSKRATSLPSTTLSTLKGARRLVDVEIRPWSMTTDEVGGVIVQIHDVTEFKTTQHNLERANDELIQFNYRVSHDLLAPLKTVRGFVDLCTDELRDGNLDEVREYHALIRENVIRLGALVEDVLNLARADIDDVATSMIDIPALLSEILAKYRSKLDAASIVVSLQLDVTALHSAHVRVLQIFDNLIANAVKYFDKDKHERHIVLSTHLRPAGGVTFTIRDNGIGFDESQKDIIFGIFKRATSKYPGSGLGLYIVKKHLDHLGGRIEVLSNRDDTIFEVSIPKAKETFAP